MVILEVSFPLTIDELRKRTGIKSLSANGLTEIPLKVGSVEGRGSYCHHEKGRGVLALSGGMGKVVHLLDELFPDVILLAQVGVNAKDAAKKWEALPDTYHWVFLPTSEGPSFSTDEATHFSEGISVAALKTKCGF